jgi:hypothetical protein
LAKVCENFRSQCDWPGQFESLGRQTLRNNPKYWPGGNSRAGFRLGNMLKMTHVVQAS